MSDFKKSPPPKLFEDLQKIIASAQPKQSILIANDDRAEDCLKLFDQSKGVCDTFSPRQAEFDRELNRHKRYDLGIAWHLNSELPEKQADNRIATLRDCLCERLYLYETIDHPILKSELCGHLRALGLLLTKTYGNIAAFYFDIYDYKDVPDWLNSDFWANPELWGKARW